MSEQERAGDASPLRASRHLDAPVGRDEMQPCGVNHICEHLANVLTTSGRGFYELHAYRQAGGCRFLGVGYRTKQSAAPRMLNFCPFCGRRPGTWEAAANKEGQHRE